MVLCPQEIPMEMTMLLPRETTMGVGTFLQASAEESIGPASSVAQAGAVQPLGCLKA